MTRSDKYNAIWWAAYDEAQAHRVDEAVAIRHAYATALLWWYWGYTWPQRPDIISGFRSPAHQAVLRARWDRGDRRGLVARPACQSWHTIGRAIDVQDGVPGFEAYAWLLRQMGMRDGRSFGDSGHFDLPSEQQPPNICVT